MVVVVVVTNGMSGKIPVSRRNVLRGMAVAGAVGVGGVAFSGGGAAATVEISTEDVTVKNDRGQVSEVFVDPEITFKWSNFDTAVGGVSIFIEARVDDESGPNADGFYPLHRSEPIMLPDEPSGMTYTGPGTTGEFSVGPFSALAENRVDGDDWDGGTNSQGHVYVSHPDGTPDYSGANDGYLNGGNVSENTIPDSDKLVNGEYGAASGVGLFEATDDGSDTSTPATIRYTFQFIQYGLDHFTQITGFDLVEETDGTIGGIRQWLQDHYDDRKNTWTGDVDPDGFLDDVKPDDITVVGITDAGDYTFDESEPITWETNQKLAAMTGPEEDFHDGEHGLVSRSADVSRAYDDDLGGIPPIHYTTSDFDIEAVNEAIEDDDTSSTGESGSGGS